ncbi:hypothetical protein SAMN05421770_10118 [Granulicella rosea]|uniref:Zinc-finger n=1 Tax=Granulicella rosea TaxID=474952 RepID=A0A239CPU8_9BACT|nr:hypothetical protein [Granulicella rosea]SNS21534.1 hypothetical protein SAMN05421770_10118 [Granulicella rosea]
MHDSGCTDQVVGDILSGWRYDISMLSPTMRVDYEQHLHECGHCRRRQAAARGIDVLLLAVSTLSTIAFALAAVIVHRLETLARISSVHLHLRQNAVTVSLEGVAITGLIISMVLWVLVAIATPLPGFLGSLLQQRLPEDIRERFTRRHA